MHDRMEAPGPLSALSAGLPICVDLDGTILRTDTLQEAAVASFFSDWRALPNIARWLFRGKAFLKEQLAARWTFDAAQLPYDEALLQTLRRAKARGHHIVLVTAADRSIASRVRGTTFRTAAG